MAAVDFHDNPVLIQASPRDDDKPSLVLFHDGGGTVFSYYLLDPMDRNVFGLADPLALLGEPWTGGLTAMGRAYYDCMKVTIQPGPIILGGEPGWSFGGLLALEVAGLIRKDVSGPFRLAGLVLIDTVCPNGRDRKHERTHEVSSQPYITEHARRLAEASLARADKMVQTWRFPVWSDDGRRLPTVLLRAAQESRPASENTPWLQWESFAQYLEITSISIPGTHHSIFDEENSSELSRQLQSACKLFETAVVQ